MGINWPHEYFAAAAPGYWCDTNIEYCATCPCEGRYEGPTMMRCHQAALSHLQETLLKDPKSFFARPCEEILHTILQTHQLACGYLNKWAFAGSFRPYKFASRVIMGKNFVYIHPRRIEGEMLKVCLLIKSLGADSIPIKSVALLVTEFARITPFSAGNKQVSLMWMNALLVCKGIQPRTFTRSSGFNRAFYGKFFEDFLRAGIEEGPPLVE